MKTIKLTLLLLPFALISCKDDSCGCIRQTYELEWRYFQGGSRLIKTITGTQDVGCEDEVENELLQGSSYYSIKCEGL